MKNLSSLIIVVIVLAAASAFAQAAAKPAAAKALTGVVSDSMCGAKHMAKDKSAAECTRECVKAGSDYALVAGGKVYPLKGDKAEIDKYAGQRATVKGTLDGNNLSVQSITAAKKAATASGKMDHMKMDNMKGMGQMDQGSQAEKKPEQK
ncbi:MAG TPA: hypothetical protein VJ731_16515 [Terriglobales bacterium]|nr:hypothetical protein [Terriglobales bacterium]